MCYLFVSVLDYLGLFGKFNIYYQIRIYWNMSKIIFDIFNILNFILQMRKYQDKDKVFKFKGSIFVQFETRDDAEAFMSVESVKYEDTELIRKWA